LQNLSAEKHHPHYTKDMKKNKVVKIDCQTLKQRVWDQFF